MIVDGGCVCFGCVRREISRGEMPRVSTVT